MPFINEGIDASTLQRLIFLFFNKRIHSFNDLEKQSFWKQMGKRENAGYQHFLFFPQCFLPFQVQISIFESILFLKINDIFTPEYWYILCLNNAWKATLTLYQTTRSRTWPNWKHLQMKNQMWLKWQFPSLIEKKTVWEKEEKLITSLLLQGC